MGPGREGGVGDHGILVERGNARARAADRGARVAEDNEALRPDLGPRDGGREAASAARRHLTTVDREHGQLWPARFVRKCPPARKQHDLRAPGRNPAAKACGWTFRGAEGGAG